MNPDNIKPNTNEHAAANIIMETDELVKTKETLVARMTDAQKALEIGATTFKKSWVAWLDDSRTMLPELRQHRMAMTTEMNVMLNKFGDVRKFFLSPDHDKEVVRLREFVELCERLAKAKKDGTLDLLKKL